MAPLTRASISAADNWIPFAFLAQTHYPEDPSYQCDISKWLESTPRSNPLRAEVLKFIKRHVDNPASKPTIAEHYRSLLLEHAQSLVNNLFAPTDNSLEDAEDFVGCISRTGAEGVEMFNSELIVHLLRFTSAYALDRLIKAHNHTHSPSAPAIQKLVTVAAKDFFPRLDPKTTLDTFETVRILLSAKVRQNPAAQQPQLRRVFETPEFAFAVLSAFHSAQQEVVLNSLFAEMLEDQRLQQLTSAYLSEYLLVLFHLLQDAGISCGTRPFSTAWRMAVSRYVSQSAFEICAYVRPRLLSFVLVLFSHLS